MTRPVAVAYAAAAVLAATALCATLWRGPAEPGIALVFGLVIVVGELARVRLPAADGGSRSTGPLGGAGALGYAMLGEVGGTPTHHGALQVIAVVVVASLVGLIPHVALGRAPGLDMAARTVLGVGFAAFCFQPLYNSGTLGGSIGPGPLYALCLLAITLLTGCFDAFLGAAIAAGRSAWPLWPLLREELRIRLGIVPAIAATGCVLALAVAVAGLWALPVFCVPLLLTQFSFRRYASVRATYRQTIASLARATEVAGYTPHGHARAVADLSRAVGRELGLPGPELTVLEYAALMHDIGQLSLVDPVPGGATAGLDPAEQRRIALLGGAVVRQTGVHGQVATVVERQADPYREQPVTARVVRTVNAYEDLTAGSGHVGSGARERALEQLRLATACDHEPRVVEALSRVVSRGADV
ncbi:metal-dependent phosphohydrolase [Streptomyces sp. NBC_01775]|uniref:HD-GYP domain-containing protein n=1 Tax=Streptomyces sp. NBC_01775 TaxID=2975939 RepID=UPI002DDC8631|nr:metal-dependent phosphohydrolase [Streptomyces sp. NBC_01775]WSB76829.1 metal-dependent phosphohydrolase [Streptomyces sp. NBC_01775]